MAHRTIQVFTRSKLVQSTGSHGDQEKESRRTSVGRERCGNLNQKLRIFFLKKSLKLPMMLLYWADKEGKKIEKQILLI